MTGPKPDRTITESPEGAGYFWVSSQDQGWEASHLGPGLLSQLGSPQSWAPPRFYNSYLDPKAPTNAILSVDGHQITCGAGKNMCRGISYFAILLMSPLEG